MTSTRAVMETTCRLRGSARSAPGPRMLPFGRCREFRQRRALAQRPVEQVAAAIRAAFVELVRAVGAEGAFERADEGAVDIGRQIAAAPFAVGRSEERSVGTAGVSTCRSRWAPCL